MQDVVILGAGGGSRSFLWLVETVNAERPEWNILGFIDENPQLHGTTHCDLPVLGGFDWFDGTRRPLLIHGVGSPAVRRRFVEKARGLGLDFARAVAPDVRHSRFVTFGDGCLVCAGTLLTSHIKIGSHCLINLSCTIGHDSTMDDFCTLAPGVHLSGNCHLEEGVEIGAGAVILPGRRVGKNSMIGAGAVVTTDIPPNSVAVGVPAKVIKTAAA